MSERSSFSSVEADETMLQWAHLRLPSLIGRRHRGDLDLGVLLDGGRQFLHHLDEPFQSTVPLDRIEDDAPGVCIARGSSNGHGHKWLSMSFPASR